MSETRRNARAFGTNGSVVVEVCQVCGADDFEPIFFAGYLPPVNEMPGVGSRPREQPSYPAQVLKCRNCELVQIGLIVDPRILFPPSYPYTSGTTKILRENFAELARETRSLVRLTKDDLVIDIGSNDGTLLSNFMDGNRVLGIEPTDTGQLAISRGIKTMIDFFSPDSARRAVAEDGKAKIVTATNVFAHIEQPHEILSAVRELMAPDGVFISESHYWLSLVETFQYDTIYHEHLRYYSLTSLKYFLATQELEVFHAKRIPTHGGSIRVYAAEKGRYPVRQSVAEILGIEKRELTPTRLQAFRDGIVASKLGLFALLKEVKAKGARVYAVGAPSRASTLVNYVGLDESIIECVLEIKGSHKIGKYMPGTLIPVVEEGRLFDDQPEYALLLSWHIGEELIKKLTARGFRGSYIMPLPTPRVVNASTHRSASD